MDKLMIVLKKMAVKMVLGQKDKIIEGLNKKLDVPFMSEADEKELLEGLWSTIEDAVNEAAK
tara:strand:- start:11757 stop:11942 length:186 start_codon:yes stop_codon:yes gene_type:complete